MPAPSTRTRIGAVAVWTSADRPGLGDQLLGRVIGQELLARLPGWRMSPYAPLGWRRPAVTDGGAVAEPLGEHAPRRVSQIVDEATLSVVCPTFPLGVDPAELNRCYADDRAGVTAAYFTGGLGADAESVHPVLPCAVRVTDPVPPDLLPLLTRAPLAAVRDGRSWDLLRDAGVPADIAVVPHPALLLERVTDRDTFGTRRRQLRQLDVLPDGPYSVLAVGDDPLPDPDMLVDQIRDGLRAGTDVTVVVLPVGTAPVDRLGGTAVPAELVLDDRLAILAGADVVVATDEHAAAAAAGLDVRWALLDQTGAHRPAALEFGQAGQICGDVGELAGAVRVARTTGPRKDNARGAVAAFLDRLAEHAERTLTARGVDPQRRMAALVEENAALRRAHWRQRQRMLVERQRLADPLADAWRERDEARAELAAVRAENEELARRNAELDARLAHCASELANWQNTKLVRWTRPLREVYGKARG